MEPRHFVRHRTSLRHSEEHAPVWFRKPKTGPAEVSRQLRTQALTMKAGELNLAPTPGRPNVWGFMMETMFPDGVVVSLATFAEGSTSLYFSKGGGMIGGGEHASVRQAATQLLDIVERRVNDFTPTRDFPGPGTGQVRFYVRTFADTLTAEGPEQTLVDKQHALSPVYYAAHAVIAALRQVNEAKQ
jgi:hypothetical protein